jgi:hypothetical protein
MNTIVSVLEREDVLNEIVSTLNDEIRQSYVFSALRRQVEAELADISEMTFSDLTKEEKEGVSITLGRILESVVPFILARSMDVSVDRNSDGDMVVDGEAWEIKGTVGTTGWQGSTHSTKKEDNTINFVGAVYGIDADVRLVDVITGDASIVSRFFLGAWAGLDFSRLGEATKNNSRTMLRLPASDASDLYAGVATGNLVAKTKWITFTPVIV